MAWVDVKTIIVEHAAFSSNVYESEKALHPDIHKTVAVTARHRFFLLNFDMPPAIYQLSS